MVERGQQLRRIERAKEPGAEGSHEYERPKHGSVIIVKLKAIS
jgi:hypothetical protein